MVEQRRAHDAVVTTAVVARLTICHDIDQYCKEFASASGTALVPLYTDDAEASLLVRLFDAILSTECVPTKWRKGIIVSVYKTGDPTQCSNYRGLTLLTAADKLWAAVITRRVGRHVPLHDHQYGFRPGRGTLDALFNLSTVIRTRKTSGQGTYVFFLDAKKAFDTVPHHALLACLHQKGVTGKLWRIIDRMYLQASSCVRVGHTVSEAFPVQRGVAQGCPLSPLLYDVFADTLLDSVHTTVPDEGIHAGALPGHDSATLVGQSYADDMAGIATTAQGLQRVIDCVRSHSLEWEWEANTQKSVVMAFGDQATLDAAKDECWFWGTAPLKRVTSTKYLGLHFHESGCWNVHIDEIATKGHRVLGQWLPVLASSTVPVSLKRRVIATRLLPVLTYGMEVWAPSPSGRSEDTALKPIADVIDKACRLAAGLHRTAGTRAWQKRTCVSKLVLMSDFDVLPLPIQIDLAHSRYGARSTANDEHVLRLHADAASPASQSTPPAAFSAPNVMGATIRSELAATDSWVTRSQSLRQRCVTDEQRVPLSEAAKQAAATWRQHRAAAAPTTALFTRHNRRCHALLPHEVHCNPVPTVLAQSSPPLYLQCTGPVVWPIMSFRSAYLPHTHTPHARRLFSEDVCPMCEQFLMPSRGTVSDAERRWRHIYHHTFACAATVCTVPCSPLQALLVDATTEAQRFGLPDLAAVFVHSEVYDNLRFSPERVVSFLLDPVAFCKPFSPNRLVGERMACLAAAFCLQSGARLSGADVHREHLKALNLPRKSKLHTRVFPEDCVYSFPVPDPSSDSDDELALPNVDISPTRSHGVTGAHAPLQTCLGHNTFPACTMSGPCGLHEADARHNG